MAKKIKKTIKIKKKKQLLINKGIFHVNSTFNNTMITFTDDTGNVVVTSSSGQMGFKGAKKATPFAATLVAKTVLEKISNYGLQEAEIFISGVGSGRDSAVRAIITAGINIYKISDVTPIPHNGCRPKKPRRV
jgi:small subunit ribosomal protein S11